MSSTEHVYSDTLGNTSGALYSRVPLTITASEFFVDDLAANNSSGEDWDDHGFDRTRDQHHQGWDADSEPSDEDPVPEPELNQDDNPENDVWRTIPQDESLVDSDEEEEIRARWAETDQSPLLASSDTSSSNSSLPDSDGDSSSIGYPVPHPLQITTPRHLGFRTEERAQIRRLPDFFDPRLLLRRVTSLSESAYMNARARLEDILDDRALERVWPEYVGNNVFRWYQPVPVEINTVDGSFQERGTD
ncbi:uncharacterized protein FOMMEDRAFT_162174 [Fomitiporia mediterranea MF3/22]|uniref:uncharacterized protein n=1 Tax=Fomitiporia mediterranea (strain MF3/22) TaxID=694068 RepID=UPI0004408420|nr:uncharacterized protein FOMMEDRAFT_162174 [Fomitiporia mediterranea MF3/22]EJC97838.1 hypothetical protein FOMMEDRAFT_162174 [Fomitiporia mediterranea MF3/22]